MKKLLLSFSFIIAVVALNAQITITSADIAAVGKVLIVGHDTVKVNMPGAINPGPSGANQTWNFSTLVANTVDTLTFTNPNWLPFDTAFPNSNLAMINSTDSSQTFIENISSGLFVDGAYINPGNGVGFKVIHFNPSQQGNVFPDTYNSSFANTSEVDLTFPYTSPKIPGMDSARIKQITDQSVKTDGWGNIITPLGTFNSLRHRARVIQTDTVWIHDIPLFGGWIVAQATLDTSWHFSWMANNVGYTLLQFDSLKADTIRKIEWLKVLPVVGSVNEVSSISELNIFPNPAMSQINFEIKNAEIAAIEIFDLSGKRISNMPANKNNLITYNAEALANGTYFYRSIDAEGNTLNRGKFDVVK